MKYLKLVEEKPEDPKLDSPSVYYDEVDPKVHYFKNDPYNGYEYVDLGLPSGTMWAKCNVGATSEIDFGLYFAWGETTGYSNDGSHSFDWENYKWCSGATESGLTKYCTVSSYGYEGFKDDLYTLLPEDDAARVNMGGKWSMPNIDDIDELTANTNYVFTTLNGVSGVLFTSKIDTNNTLFFPFAGYMSGTAFNNAYFRTLGNQLYPNVGGEYDKPCLVLMMFAQKSILTQSTSLCRGMWYRQFGYTVRGIVKKS